MGRTKSLEEIKAEVRDHTGKKKIFRRAKKDDVESVLANLTSKDPELWAAEWSRVARPHGRGRGEPRASRPIQRSPHGLSSGLHLLCHRPISCAPYFGKDALS